MSYKQLTASLAQRWLAGVEPFHPALLDTGRRYNGCPVFDLYYTWAGCSLIVSVYRYTPANSEFSVLAFVPEKV